MTSCFKPAQVADLLDIGEQKLRYWREHLDPNPYRSEFSIMDLLAFRIILVLIEKRNFTANQLEKFKLIELFVWCHETKINVIEQTVLEIHTARLTLSFLDNLNKPDLNDYDADYISLKGIVSMHDEKVNSIGCENWEKRVFDARAKTHH
jgi:hypothetical protein